MAEWHHRLDGRESEWTLGVGDGQGGLACCNWWGHKELDTTEQLNWTELNSEFVFCPLATSLPATICHDYCRFPMGIVFHHSYLFLCRLLLCHSCSISCLIFSNTCSICRYRFSVLIEGDEFRVFLSCHFALPPVREYPGCTVPWKERWPMVQILLICGQC